MINLSQDNARKILHQSQFPAKIVKRRALADKIVVFGLAADRPTDSETGVFVYFATDTDTFSCYNGSAWVEEVLT